MIGTRLSQVALLDVATGTLTPLVSEQTVSDPACPLTLRTGWRRLVVAAR